MEIKTTIDDNELIDILLTKRYNTLRKMYTVMNEMQVEAARLYKLREMMLQEAKHLASTLENLDSSRYAKLKEEFDLPHMNETYGKNMEKAYKLARDKYETVKQVALSKEV